MPELLWRLVSDRPAEKIFAKRIKALSDSDLQALAHQYMNVRYALMQAIWEHDKDAGASEDTIEDVVDWLILGGPDALAATLAGTPPLPARETWSDLEESSLFYGLSSEIKTRFKQSIYDVTGADYPYPWTTSSSFEHVDYLGPTKN